MSRIEAAFKNILDEGQKAFIPFMTAGDPDLEATERFIYALEEVGSTMIELGIPFSDPMADGPIIQRANIRAMAQGIHLEKVFEMVERVRERTEIPLVFLMYANTIYHYQIEAFFRRCQEVGVDGVIVPDVPMEEKDEFDRYAKVYEVDWISLVAPTSKERTRAICETARGFLYCVSSLGVTGTRDTLETDFKEMFETIQRSCKIPTTLGFGISNKAQASALKAYADGVIVGSAVVKIIEEHGRESVEPLKAFVREMREGV